MKPYQKDHFLRGDTESHALTLASCVGSPQLELEHQEFQPMAKPPQEFFASWLAKLFDLKISTASTSWSSVVGMDMLEIHIILQIITVLQHQKCQGQKALFL